MLLKLGQFVPALATSLVSSDGRSQPSSGLGRFLDLLSGRGSDHLQQGGQAMLQPNLQRRRLKVSQLAVAESKAHINVSSTK